MIAEILVNVSFLKHTLIKSDAGVVEGDYNTTKLVFNFEEDVSESQIFFKMSDPNGTPIFLYELTSHEVTLVGYDEEGKPCSLFNGYGLYPFELVCYSDNGKITSAPGWMNVSKRQVPIADGGIIPKPEEPETEDIPDYSEVADFTIEVTGLEEELAINYSVSEKVALPSGRNLLASVGDSNFKASNIKKNVSIFGLTGTYEGGGNSTPNLDGVEVTPTKDYQNITAESKGLDGFDEVTVKPIPDSYIIPSGTKEITANGTYDVTDKASIEVAVPSKEPDLEEITITENGEYTPSGDGYSKVTVAVKSGGEGGGGAELNIAYGDTAPEDTSKLWVKTTQPSAVLVDSETNTSLSEEQSLQTLPEASPVTFGFGNEHMALVGDKIYFLAHYNKNGVHCFDLETETFKTLSATGTASNWNATLVQAVGTKIYAFGSSHSSYKQYGWCFDTETEQFHTLGTNFFTITYYHGMSTVAFGNKIYLLGGCDGGHNASNLQNTIYAFDTETETFSTLSTTLAEATAWAATAVIGTKLYLLGGEAGGYKGKNTIQWFDLETETSGKLSVTLPATPYAPRGGVIGTKIYIFAKTGVWCFDTETETTTTLNVGYPTNLAEVITNSVEDSIYIFGGVIQFDRQTAIYKFGFEEFVTLSADTLQIVSAESKNKFALINDNNITINSGVEKVYKGNADGIGEQVEAALHNGTSWVTI